MTRPPRRVQFRTTSSSCRATRGRAATAARIGLARRLSHDRRDRERRHYRGAGGRRQKDV